MDIQWFQENAIAIYGAVVGTIALFLNLGRFWIMYQKSVRKLKVEYVVSDSAQHQIDQAANPSDMFGKRSNRDPKSLVGPIYKVTVRNVSHISMHIHDVGLIVTGENGLEKYQALVRGHSFLQRLTESGGDDIAAGSSKTYNVWISGDLVLPDIKGCYVIDQLGKQYKGSNPKSSIELTVPELLQEQA
ncbi:hypothetical protein NB502_14260 [Vibrio diabolicus]|uniref:hypothetical protein n=1 Tax=Vibrio diabolicus TaxID=50719 RepID=UPI00215B8BC9|nr:hypothetical protein [Vibrio diabolicus]MCR9473020.1 hypothetical protein [Vibrio diabolicus]